MIQCKFKGARGGFVTVGSSLRRAWMAMRCRSGAQGEGGAVGVNTSLEPPSGRGSKRRNRARSILKDPIADDPHSGAGYRRTQSLGGKAFQSS